MRQIAVLGWGSLLWEKQQEFNSHLQYEIWDPLGPELKLEFSRISKSRDGALTLVIDEYNGAVCSTYFNLCEAQEVGDARAALMRRERCSMSSIGFVDAVRGNGHGRSPKVVETIKSWARHRKMNAVIWTDLPSNFSEKTGNPFSVDNAVKYLFNLGPLGQAKAKQYIREAAENIETPVRSAIASSVWFKA